MRTLISQKFFSPPSRTPSRFLEWEVLITFGENFLQFKFLIHSQTQLINTGWQWSERELSQKMNKWAQTSSKKREGESFSLKMTFQLYFTMTWWGKFFYSSFSFPFLFRVNFFLSFSLFLGWNLKKRIRRKLILIYLLKRFFWMSSKELRGERKLKEKEEDKVWKSLQFKF